MEEKITLRGLVFTFFFIYIYINIILLRRGIKKKKKNTFVCMNYAQTVFIIIFFF